MEDRDHVFAFSVFTNICITNTQFTWFVELCPQQHENNNSTYYEVAIIMI